MSSENENSAPEAERVTASQVADRKTWSIKPKKLSITWGEESSYWRIDEGDGPAELLRACWLEVKGSVLNVTKGKKYEIKFKLSKKVDAVGWDETPVFIMAKIGRDSEDQLSEAIYLSGLGEEPDETTAKFQIEFNRDNQTEDPTLYFGLYEVWDSNWKGGLLIYEAIVQEAVTADGSAATTTQLRA